MMTNDKQHPVILRKNFALRLSVHLFIVFLLLLLSLVIGIAGYMRWEHLSFIDALLNSAMLLGGMGPVNAPVTAQGKWFASFYALYAGLFFIIVSGLIFTPVFHYILHKFHWDDKI